MDRALDGRRRLAAAEAQLREARTAGDTLEADLRQAQLELQELEVWRPRHRRPTP